MRASVPPAHQAQSLQSPAMLLAITHPPSEQIARCQLTYVSRTPINHRRALRQHEAYCRVLRDCGATIRRLDGNRAMPDCAFVEDTAFSEQYHVRILQLFEATVTGQFESADEAYDILDLLHNRSGDGPGPFAALTQDGVDLGFLTFESGDLRPDGAQPLDGKIATRTGDAFWISDETCRAHAHRVRGRLDAILVGIGTVLRDDPLLTCRAGRPRRIATRVVLDTRLRIPATSQLVRTARAAPTWVFCGTRAPARRATTF